MKCIVYRLTAYTSKLCIMLNNGNVDLFTFFERRQCFKLTFWAEKPQAFILRQEALTLLQICVFFQYAGPCD